VRYDADVIRLPLVERRRDAIAARVARDVGGALAGPRGASGEGTDAVDVERFSRAVAVAHDAADDRTRRAVDDGAGFACAAGCAWCCHVHVDATEAEVRAIAAHLEASPSREIRAAIEAGLAAAVDRAGALGDDDRWAARVPCGLLSATGECMIYEVRPLRCRTFHSTSAAACEDALLGSAQSEPPRIGPLARAHEAVEEGFERALSSAGASVAPVRLEPALLAALRERAAPGQP
jgi:Fe-S-cluster containining protein